MYKTKKFKVRPLKEILDEFSYVARYYPSPEKIFLADGDALCLRTKMLCEILKAVKFFFPSVKKVSVYANPENVLRKTKDELTLLKNLGLNLVYLGIESGDEEILRKVNKGATREEIIKSIKKAKESGITVSTTVILGLGGKKLSEKHIKNTASLINISCPNYLSLLVLMLGPFKKIFKKEMSEDFKFLNTEEILNEMKEMIKEINPKDVIEFRSNHASNYLPLKGRLPEDKEKLINLINLGLKDKSILREENLRGL
jgi:radical SAM superfamily enzyme YgiQ (UPF0313 family)